MNKSKFPVWFKCRICGQKVNDTGGIGVQLCTSCKTKLNNNKRFYQEHRTQLRYYGY